MQAIRLLMKEVRKRAFLAIGEYEAYSCILWLIGIHSADSQEGKIVNYILGCVLRSRLLHTQYVNVVPAHMINNLSVHSCFQKGADVEGDDFEFKTIC